MGSSLSVEIMHHWGHQKGEMTAIQENWEANKKAMWAALTGGQTSAPLTSALFQCCLSEWDSWHTLQEQAWVEIEGGNFLPDWWWKFTDGCIDISESLAPTFVKHFYEGTHLRQTDLKTTLSHYCYVPKLSSLGKTVWERCSLCARNNHWYLLVFVCTFSGWIKAFPT
jgi:hypothetical protein